MYLVSQLWWLLLLAFLLGAFFGYLLWRACGRRVVEEALIRNHGDSGEAKLRASQKIEADLRHELADVRAKQVSEVTRAREDTAADLGRGHAAEMTRLRDGLALTHAAELKKVREEFAAAHAAELEQSRETAKAHESRFATLTTSEASARADLSAAAAQAASVKKIEEDLQAAQAAAVKKARDETAAEASRKHAEDLKKVRDDLAIAHAADLKKQEDAAKIYEKKLAALASSEASARDELAAVVMANTAELKKMRDEAARANEVALKKARDEAAGAIETAAKKAREDADRRHADALNKVREELAAAHAAEIKKQKDLVAAHETKLSALANASSSVGDELAAARSAHAAELRQTQEEAAGRHGEELAALKRDHDAALQQLRADRTAQPPGEAHLLSQPEPAKASAPARSDDLKLIWGVGPEIERLLHENGLTRFSQMAQWGQKDVAWFESVLPNFKGRIENEKWVEQAKKLAGGWRPQRELGERPDGLEVLDGPRGGTPDDLKLIWGVGPKLEKLLHSAGFYHFDQIAKWTDKQLAWVDSQLGEFAGRAERDKWVEQAKRLAGGWRPSKNTGDRPV